MASDLILHRGAREVSLAELQAVEAPAPTSSWFPKKHANVLQTVLGTLEGAGFRVERHRLALTNGSHNFFGTLDLGTTVASGIYLAVGVRNSTNKRFPMGFCAGSRTFVCDNLAFQADLIVRRKHTKYGELRFEEAIAQAVGSLHQFQAAEAERIKRLQSMDLSEDAANSYMLRAFEKGLVSLPILPRVIAEWREPRFEEFKPRTLFSLLNAFTSALGERRAAQPAKYAAQTMRLQRFLLPAENNGSNGE